MFCSVTADDSPKPGTNGVNLPAGIGKIQHIVFIDPVALDNIAIGVPFAQTNTCGANDLGNGSCTIIVTLTPTAKGTQSGHIRITATDYRSPFTSMLTTGQ